MIQGSNFDQHLQPSSHPMKRRPQFTPRAGVFFWAFRIKHQQHCELICCFCLCNFIKLVRLRIGDGSLSFTAAFPVGSLKRR